jgi:hypothetical protein
VKRLTAVRHLTEMAGVASEMLRLRASDLGWPLEELWVSGALLAAGEDLESASVVLMLDLPADELPWLAVNPSAEWIGDRLRLGKRPIEWSYRPMVWPPWTYRYPCVARFWSARHGLDTDVIDALGSFRGLAVVEPAAGELVEQLTVELAAARVHVQAVLERYWDPSWRGANRSIATPEDRLWRAATALVEIEGALNERTA